MLITTLLIASLAIVEPTGPSNARLFECKSKAAFTWTILDLKEKGATENEAVSAVFAKLINAGLDYDSDQVKATVKLIYNVDASKDVAAKRVMKYCMGEEI